MIKRLFQFPLRIKISAVFLLAAAVPLAIAAVLITRRLEDSERNDSRQESISSAQVAASRIESFLRMRIHILENAGAAYQELPVEGDTRKRFLEQTLFHDQYLNSLVFINADGREVDTVLKFSAAELEDHEDEFQEIKKTRLFIGNLEIKKSLPSLHIGTTVTTSTDGSRQFTGALFADVDARVLQNVVNSLSEANTEREVFLVDEGGSLIAHPNSSKILRDKEILVENKEFRTLINNALSHRKGSAQVYKTDEAIPAFAAALPLKIDTAAFRSPLSGDTPTPLWLPWVVVSQEPASRALAEVGVVWRITLAILVGVALLGIAATVAISLAIVRPVERLYRATQKFKRGKYNTRVEISTGDEIEKLGNEFNDMAGKISASFKQVEQEQQATLAERNKLSMIVAGIQDGVIVTDLNKRIILINKAAISLLGYPEKEAKGKKIHTVLHIFDKEHQRKLTSEEFCPKFNGTEKVSFRGDELRLLGKNNKEVFVNLTSGHIKEGGQMNVGCIITLHDITEKHRVEMLKSEFLSIAAHQLRTPLSSVRWASSTLVREVKQLTEKRKKELRSIILRSAERMVNLVNNLLNTARIEQGKLAEEAQTVNLQGIINAILEKHDEDIKKKELELTTQMPDTELRIEAGPQALQLAVENIIKNAIDYSPNGADIQIRLIKDGNTARIEVEDHGIGIPEEAKEVIFSRFYRAKNAISMHTEGSGLGLFITKKIIETHKGKITFTSQQDEGTTFTIHLPLKNSKKDKSSKRN